MLLSASQLDRRESEPFSNLNAVPSKLLRNPVEIMIMAMSNRATARTLEAKCHARYFCSCFCRCPVKR